MSYYEIQEFMPMFNAGILIPSFYEQFIEVLKNKTKHHRCIKKIEEHIRDGHLYRCIILTSRDEIALLFSNAPEYTARNYTLKLIV